MDNSEEDLLVVDSLEDFCCQFRITHHVKEIRHIHVIHQYFLQLLVKRVGFYPYSRIFVKFVVLVIAVEMSLMRIGNAEFLSFIQT